MIGRTFRHYRVVSRSASRYNRRVSDLGYVPAVILFLGEPSVRPVFVLDVAERSIDLLTRGRFIDDYCNVLTANGRTVKDDPDLTPEENEHKLFLAAVTEIQKDNDIRIADTAASLTTVIAQFYEQALKKAVTVEDYQKLAKTHLELLAELSAVLQKLSLERAKESREKETPKEGAL